MMIFPSVDASLSFAEFLSFITARISCVDPISEVNKAWEEMRGGDEYISVEDLEEVSEKLDMGLTSTFMSMIAVL